MCEEGKEVERGEIDRVGGIKRGEKVWDIRRGGGGFGVKSLCCWM